MTCSFLAFSLAVLHFRLSFHWCKFFLCDMLDVLLMIAHYNGSDSNEDQRK
jgi:hypothetical protein